MKRLRLALIAVIFVGTILYFVIPAFLFPSGVWRRRVVRENPLKAPTQITSIRGETLIADRQEFRLGGVKFPTDASLAARAAEFLRVATAQGVEVIRSVQPEGTFILRCEPRIWHWCGNDPVKAHFEQHNLSELVIAFGFATVAPLATGLTENERLFLTAAESFAKERRLGMWSEHPGSAERSFRPVVGLNISDTSYLQKVIDLTAEDIADHR